MINLDSRSTALVVIDVQNDYFPGGRFPLFRANAALKKILILRDWARQRATPVYWVRHTSRPDSPFFRPETHGRELHPDLDVGRQETIVDKTTPNSFFGTNLEAILRAQGIRTVVWAGMMTWMCVDTTVRAAKDLGFQNYLAHDACAAGWLKGPHGIISPWTFHRSFVAALGFHHATVASTKALASY